MPPGRVLGVFAGVLACGGISERERLPPDFESVVALHCELASRSSCFRQQSAENCELIFQTELEDAEALGCGAQYREHRRCLIHNGFQCLRGQVMIWNGGCDDEEYQYETCLRG